jgi:hypothetical protein
MLPKTASKPVKLRTKNVFRFAPESGRSICAFLEAISSGERLDLHPRHCKLLALARQPQVVARQVTASLSPAARGG